MILQNAATTTKPPRPGRSTKWRNTAISAANPTRRTGGFAACIPPKRAQPIVDSVYAAVLKWNDILTRGMSDEEIILAERLDGIDGKKRL